MLTPPQLNSTNEIKSYNQNSRSPLQAPIFKSTEPADFDVNSHQYTSKSPPEPPGSYNDSPFEQFARAFVAEADRINCTQDKHSERDALSQEATYSEQQHEEPTSVPAPFSGNTAMICQHLEPDTPAEFFMKRLSAYEAAQQILQAKIERAPARATTCNCQRHAPPVSSYVPTLTEGATCRRQTAYTFRQAQQRDPVSSTAANQRNTTTTPASAGSSPANGNCRVMSTTTTLTEATTRHRATASASTATLTEAKADSSRAQRANMKYDGAGATERNAHVREDRAFASALRLRKEEACWNIKTPVTDDEAQSSDATPQQGFAAQQPPATAATPSLPEIKPPQGATLLRTAVSQQPEVPSLRRRPSQGGGPHVGGGGDVAPKDIYILPRNRRYVKALKAVFDGSLYGIDKDGVEAIVDSGANGHFLGKYIKRLLRQRQASHFVRVADGSAAPVDAVGDFEIPVQDTDGTELDPLLLKDASLLKSSPFNLISVGVLCDAGSVFHFEKKNSWFSYQGRKFPLIERDGLYILRLDDILQAQAITDLEAAENASDCGKDSCNLNGTRFGCAATFDLWHSRLGHASKARLKVLYKSGAAEGFQVAGKRDKHERGCKCPTCVAVNNERVHIGDVRRFEYPYTQVGQLVVSDLCGPFPESIDGYCYTCTFIDAYSRFSAVYFLKQKSDAEDALRSLILFYRREGFIIKELRTDQGGEYGGGNERLNVAQDAAAADDDGFVFTRICAENDIIHHVTPPRRPERHGLAENYNRVVFRMANSFLYNSRISHLLWASTVAHANAVRNRLPHSGLGAHTPYELFFKRRPRLNDFKVWGCDCYKLLPAGQIPGQQNRRRLIYVGHTPDRMGWRCFDPITFKFSTEFELIFDEASSKKRINALREYDLRRELAKRGKLDDLPLMADDFDEGDASKLAQQDSERRLYTKPLPSPEVSGRGGGSQRNRAVPRAPRIPGNKSALQGAGPIEARSKSQHSSDQRAKAGGELAMDPYSDDGDDMGSPSELIHQSYPSERFSNNAQFDGVDISGPLSRSGRHPTVRVTDRPRRKSESV